MACNWDLSVCSLCGAAGAKTLTTRPAYGLISSWPRKTSVSAGTNRTALNVFHPSQIADYRLQCPVKQQGIIKHMQLFSFKRQSQAGAILVQNFHAMAVNKNVAARGTNDR